MGEYKQSNRQLKIETPLGPDVLLMKGYTVVEGLSQLFSIRMEMIASNDDRDQVTFDKLIGQKLTVKVLMADESTYHPWNGVCVRFGQGEKDSHFTSYYAELVPDLWKLTRKSQSRIFQRMTVPDILKKVLTGLDVSYQIQGQFEPRDYCVQYRETDFNFASRLMEEEGIFYFFKHSDGSHKLVLANTPDAHPDVPGPSTITYEEVEGGVRDDNRIWGWRKEQLWRSGKAVLWDHCFELPHKHLEAERPTQDSAQFGKETHKLKLGGNDAFELYDWPGEYAQRFDGVDKGGGEQPAELQKIFRDNERTVRIRMEEETALALTARGESNVKHLVSGHKFTLKRHFTSDGAYVLTTVTHSATFGADFRAEEEPLISFSNSFTAIPLAVPYRPRRLTPKPVVPGCQTAVVVGPSGEEIFTDKYGRVKVQFHWDREGKNDEGSSCWMRVGQLMAGRRWGASFWPRVGQEVIVDFLEGDADQPIVVGVVYNADQMPPYLGNGPDAKHRNDNKVSGIKTNTTTGGQGFNELRFDDTKDKQQVFLHAEKDLDARVKADWRESVLDDKNVTVGGEKDGKKQGDFKELVYKDRHIEVKGIHEEKIGKSMALTIGADGGGSLNVNVAGSRAVTMGGTDDQFAKSDMTLASEAQLSVGGKVLFLGGGDKATLLSNGPIVIDAGGGITIKGESIVLAAGTGSVILNQAGVQIDGAKVEINCGSGPGGDDPDGMKDPKKARKAEPKTPDVADDAKTGQKSS